VTWWSKHAVNIVNAYQLMICPSIDFASPVLEVWVPGCPALKSVGYYANCRPVPYIIPLHLQISYLIGSFKLNFHNFRGRLYGTSNKINNTLATVGDPGFLKGGGWLNGGGQTEALRPRTAIGRADGYRPLFGIAVWNREVAALSAPKSATV